MSIKDYTSISNGAAIANSSGANAAISTLDAESVIAECTAASGFTCKVEGQLHSGGDWQKLPCIQLSSNVHTARAANATLTVADNDFLFINCGGYFQVRIIRVGGSATFDLTATPSDVAHYKAPVDTSNVIRQMLEEDTITLAASTAASMLSGTTSISYKGVRIVNNSGAIAYFKYQTSPGANPTASLTNYSFTLDAGAWAQLDIAETVGLSGYSVGGGNFLVEILY